MKGIWQGLGTWVDKLERILGRTSDPVFGWLVLGIGISALLPAAANVFASHMFKGYTLQPGVSASYMGDAWFFFFLFVLGLLRSRYTLLFALWQFYDSIQGIIPAWYSFLCGADTHTGFGPHHLTGPVFPWLIKYCPNPSQVPFFHMYPGMVDSPIGVGSGWFMIYINIGRWAFIGLIGETLLVLLTIAALIWLMIRGALWVRRRFSQGGGQ